jgi:hypothetical protein
LLKIFVKLLFSFLLFVLAGSLVEVLVNTTGAPRTEEIEVTAYSPTGRSLRCPLKKVTYCSQMDV